MKKFSIVSLIALAIVLTLSPIRLNTAFAEDSALVNIDRSNAGLAPEGVITQFYIIILSVALTLVSSSLIKTLKKSKA